MRECFRSIRACFMLDGRRFVCMRARRNRINHRFRSMRAHSKKCADAEGACEPDSNEWAAASDRCGPASDGTTPAVDQYEPASIDCEPALGLANADLRPCIPSWCFAIRTRAVGISHLGPRYVQQISTVVCQEGILAACRAADTSRRRDLPGSPRTNRTKMSAFDGRLRPYR